MRGSGRCRVPARGQSTVPDARSGCPGSPPGSRKADVRPHASASPRSRHRRRRRLPRWPCSRAAAAATTTARTRSTRPARRPTQILDLFTPFFWIAVVVGVGVVGGTIFVALRFREKPGERRSPKQVHGNTVLEISWTIVPALILAVMAVFTIPVIFDLARSRPATTSCTSTSPAASGSGSTSTPTTSSSPPTRCTSRSAARSAWTSPRPPTASSTRSGCRS